MCRFRQWGVDGMRLSRGLHGNMSQGRIHAWDPSTKDGIMTPPVQVHAWAVLNGAPGMLNPLAVSRQRRACRCCSCVRARARAV